MKIFTSEELLKRGEIKNWQYRLPQFNDKTIMIYDSSQEAARFITLFGKHYVSEHGEQKAEKFPMLIVNPETTLSEVIFEELDFKEQRNQKTWLMVPTDRFNDVKKFLGNYNK